MKLEIRFRDAFQAGLTTARKLPPFQMTSPTKVSHDESNEDQVRPGNQAPGAGASPKVDRRVTQGKTRMTPSEAFVETLVAQGVTDVFGIVGSAYMDALDLFPSAGIRFISVAHEQGAAATWPMATRVSGRHGVCIAQNGPGITNFVTATAAAYWAHSPVVVITPETGSMTLGLGGFQETEQLPIFSKITKFQSHVNNKLRMAELTARALTALTSSLPDAAQHPA